MILNDVQTCSSKSLTGSGDDPPSEPLLRPSWFFRFFHGHPRRLSSSLDDDSIIKLNGSLKFSKHYFKCLFPYHQNLYKFQAHTHIIQKNNLNSCQILTLLRMFPNQNLQKLIGNRPQFLPKSHTTWNVSLPWKPVLKPFCVTTLNPWYRYQVTDASSSHPNWRFTKFLERQRTWKNLWMTTLERKK